MTIFVNPMASGGTGRKKWERVRRTLESNCGTFTVKFIEGFEPFQRDIANALESGELEFVAAGGDGTINILLHELLSLVSGDQVQRLRIGAIGLGSSNDFHKPFQSGLLITGIPTAVDFSRAQFRDVGCLTYENDGEFQTQHFLSNASVGATAEANFLFNHPGRILRYLKRYSSGSAIFYAAVTTLAHFRNLVVNIESGGYRASSIRLSNLAIVKNRHFSGSLHYNRQPAFDDGQFFFYLSKDMNHVEILELVAACSRGKSDRITKMESWASSCARLTASQPFAVEYDGEVRKTKYAEFNTLQRCIQVCTC